MRNLTEQNLTDAVLAKLEGATDERFKQVMTSLITHLHAFVREVELTEAEWFAGIQFLTATGQKCDDKRQEYILLSDTLGVSMLVDAINHRKPTGATESTVLGPFYVPNAPELASGANIAEGIEGEPAYFAGRIRPRTARRSRERRSTCGPPTARAGTTCSSKARGCARAARSARTPRAATRSGRSSR
jgi:hydroxyquinol 1,2-dioxygenase